MTMLCTMSSSIRTAASLIGQLLSPPFLTLHCVAPFLFFLWVFYFRPWAYMHLLEKALGHLLRSRIKLAPYWPNLKCLSLVMLLQI